MVPVALIIGSFGLSNVGVQFSRVPAMVFATGIIFPGIFVYPRSLWASAPGPCGTWLLSVTRTSSFL